VQRLATRWAWFRRLAIPIVVLLPMTVAWAGAITAATHHLVGVTTNVNGKPLSFVQTLLLYAPRATPAVLAIQLVVLSILAALRRHFRWWLHFAILVFAGLPVGVFIGRTLTEHLWSRGGSRLSEVLAPALALPIVWVLSLAVDLGLDALGRGRKRRRAKRGICTHCGYDLRGQIAAGHDVCSECGRPFDLALFRDAAG
jgi:MFS superfamily sulfate permease-like transporter